MKAYKVNYFVHFHGLAGRGGHGKTCVSIEASASEIMGKQSGR